MIVLVRVGIWTEMEFVMVMTTAEKIPIRIKPMVTMIAMAMHATVVLERVLWIKMVTLSAMALITVPMILIRIRRM
jgi:hypothetical protein